MACFENNEVGPILFTRGSVHLSQTNPGARQYRHRRSLLGFRGPSSQYNTQSQMLQERNLPVQHTARLHKNPCDLSYTQWRSELEWVR